MTQVIIGLEKDFLDESYDDSSYLYLSIICGALKYCLGQASTMSFIKLGYIFDKAIHLEKNAFKSKSTLSTWNISSTFRKFLIMAFKNKFIEIIPKGPELKISLSPEGEEYISEIEALEVFLEHLDYLKNISLPENKFDNFSFRCGC